MPSLQKGGEYANAQPYPLIQYPRTDAYLSVGIAWVQYTAVARARRGYVHACTPSRGMNGAAPHRAGGGGASCDPLTGSADSFAYRRGHAWAQGAVEV